MVFNPKDPELEQGYFASMDTDWIDFYGDIVEALQPRTPEQIGKSVHTTFFLDADYTRNVVTRQSQTGVIFFLWKRQLFWFFNKHNTVDSSTFWSEFVPKGIIRDFIVALGYKLNMFEESLHGPSDTMCDNQGVVKNTSLT